MQYLIQMNIIPQARPASSEEGQVFFRNYIHPTLRRCQKLKDDGKILAGGPMSGTIGIALIIETGTVKELDELLTSLPVWTRMETTVIPLTTFADRAAAIEDRLRILQEENARNTEPQS
jgi:muconolactone delta-isomerase